MKTVAMLDFGKFKIIVKCHKRKKNPFEVCFRIKGYTGFVDSTLEEFANFESCMYYIKEYIEMTEDAQEALKAESFSDLFRKDGMEK